MATDYARPANGNRESVLSRPEQIPSPLYVFLCVSTLLTLIGLLTSLLFRSMHWGLPYSFPYYFVPGDLGGDFRFFFTKFSLYPSWRFYSGEAGYFMYPLPLFFLLRVLFFSARPFVLFALLVVLLVSAMVWIFARAMRSAGLAGNALVLFLTGTVLLSYPLAYEFMRQNVEIVLFSLTAFGIVAWYRGRPALAAVLFGVAAACKLYPLILLGLFFYKKTWRSFVVGVATAIVCTLAAAKAFGPTIHDALAWDSFQLSLFQSMYAGLPMQLGYDHSFFGLVKLSTLHWHPNLTRLVPVYVKLAAVISIVLYFARIRKLPAVNQLIVLSILSITLPPVSYDYTLLAVYPPLVLLSMEACRRTLRGEKQFPKAMHYFILFGVVLTPLSFVAFFGRAHGAQLRCVCLIVIVWMALRHPITEEANSVSVDQKWFSRSNATLA